MPLGNATGGGDYVNRDEWLRLANAGTLVMFRVLAHLDPEKLSDKVKTPADPVRADVVLVGGPRDGEVLMSEKLVGKGFTDMLRREKVGAHVAARLVARKNGATEYAAANPCSGPELEALDVVYTKYSENPWDAIYEQNREAATAAADNGEDDGAPF